MNPGTGKSFEEWISDAAATEQVGWDFSRFAERWMTAEPGWDYATRARQAVSSSVALLDMGTGGGEFLSSLTPLPRDTWATEGYAPNFLLASQRLAPLGGQVVAVADDDVLPFSEKRFDVILNRHESFSPSEIFRVLREDGTFLTQQVGGQDCRAVNEFLQDEVVMPYTHWTLDSAVAGLEQAGLKVTRALEEFPETSFSDIGALMHFLRVTPWQVEGFSISRYAPRLRELHQKIENSGRLTVKSHRFFIEARKPQP